MFRMPSMNPDEWGKVSTKKSSEFREVTRESANIQSIGPVEQMKPNNFSSLLL